MIVWWLQTEKSLHISFPCVPAIPGAGHLYWMVILILITLSSCGQFFRAGYVSCRGVTVFAVLVSFVLLTVLRVLVEAM